MSSKKEPRTDTKRKSAQKESCHRNQEKSMFQGKGYQQHHIWHW